MGLITRMNTSSRPSGENAGLRSLVLGEARVSRRCSPVSAEIRKIDSASPSDSEAAIHLPFADQSSALAPRATNWASRRSAPPMAGATQTEFLWPSVRRYAIRVPSADHVG